MRLGKMPLFLVLSLAALAPGEVEAFNPLTAILTLNQVQRGFSQVRKGVRKVRNKLLQPTEREELPEMGPLLEKMRSPFEKDRLEGAQEMLEIANRFQDHPERIPELGRAEILLGQLLRDSHWKTRHTAYRTLTRLDLLEEIQDPAERFALIFPRKTPERRDLVVSTAVARGPSDVDLLYDFLAALKTRKPQVRTQLAGVLENLVGELSREPSQEETPPGIADVTGDRPQGVLESEVF